MDSEKTINYIVNWLSDYAKKANVKGFVIGVSGGIDSALTSTLGALTNLPVLCLEMPIHQDKNQVSRSKEHILYLKNKYKNISSIETDLTLAFETLKNTFQPINDEKKQALALANVRARLRMTTLYYYAQKNNYLVLGTGNKVEDFGVGFYTKYGDGGVDISPIADLYKSEVYQLAAYLGISSSILKAPPTDGLWGDERTDEEQIGATYPELEWAMQLIENKSVDESKFSEREKEVFEIYVRLNKINQHKMKPIPVCVIQNK